MVSRSNVVAGRKKGKESKAKFFGGWLTNIALELSAE